MAVYWTDLVLKQDLAMQLKIKRLIAVAWLPPSRWYGKSVYLHARKAVEHCSFHDNVYRYAVLPDRRAALYGPSSCCQQFGRCTFYFDWPLLTPLRCTPSYDGAHSRVQRPAQHCVPKLPVHVSWESSQFDPCDMWLDDRPLSACNSNHS